MAASPCYGHPVGGETRRGENKETDERIDDNAGHTTGNPQPRGEHPVMPATPSRVSQRNTQRQGELENADHSSNTTERLAARVVPGLQANGLSPDHSISGENLLSVHPPNVGTIVRSFVGGSRVHALLRQMTQGSAASKR